MKHILTAAALAAVLATPAIAEEAVTSPQPQATVQEIVPAATEPATGAAQPATTETQSKASMKGGHNCGSKQTVYLTN